MPLTDSSEVVASYIEGLIEAAAATYDTPIQDVFYGDQDLIPQTPAVCVQPGPKMREFQGASLRTLNLFDTFVYVYFGKIQDVQLNLHGCNALANAIERTIHVDLTLGGNVTSVLCIQNEPGVINKKGLMLASRLLFRSQSKTMLP